MVTATTSASGLVQVIVDSALVGRLKELTWVLSPSRVPWRPDDTLYKAGDVPTRVCEEKTLHKSMPLSCFGQVMTPTVANQINAMVGASEPIGCFHPTWMPNFLSR
jgi:hypothetical protein